MDWIGNLFDALGSMPTVGGISIMLAVAAIYPDATDEDLVTRCKNGDRIAFGDLVERHQDRVYSLCFRYLGDRSIAEEVAQDVFLSAWRALPRFREEARFDTWLRRITVNKCKNRRLYRHRRAHGLHESIDARATDDDAPDLQLVHGGRGADASAHVHQAAELLEAALAELDEGQRTLVLLRDMEDLSYGEIAEILEVPRGTVKSRLHRARAALAKVLGTRIGREDVF